MIVTRMLRSELGQLCRAVSASLLLADTVGPDGLELQGARLLWALCGQESNFGSNMTPRHEPSWDKGGHLYDTSAELQLYIDKYGGDGACSYGPLQAMAFNLQPYEPMQLAADPVLAFTASIKFFNAYVVQHWKDKTLQDICNTWNAGNPKAKAAAGYVENVTRYYLGGVVP